MGLWIASPRLVLDARGGLRRPHMRPVSMCARVDRERSPSTIRIQKLDARAHVSIICVSTTRTHYEKRADARGRQNNNTLHPHVLNTRCSTPAKQPKYPKNFSRPHSTPTYSSRPHPLCLLLQCRASISIRPAPSGACQ